MVPTSKTYTEPIFITHKSKERLKDKIRVSVWKTVAVERPFSSAHIPKLTLHSGQGVNYCAAGGDLLWGECIL